MDDFVDFYLFFVSSGFFVLLVSLDDLGLEALERGGGDVVDQGVHGALGVLVLVALAGHADANAEGDVLDALGPEVLVEGDGEADVVGAHVLLGEGADLADGAGSTGLEGPKIWMRILKIWRNLEGQRGRTGRGGGDDVKN